MKKVLLVLTVWVGISGCSKDNSATPEKTGGTTIPEPPVGLTISVGQTLSVASKANAISIPVNSGHDWTLELESHVADRDWLRADNYSGPSGKSTVVFTLSENPDDPDRAATVTFRNLNDQIRTFELVQWGVGHVDGANPHFAMKSVILDQKHMPYGIYLPPGYDGRKEFPVLYFFHGLGGSAWKIAENKNISPVVQKSIEAGKIVPMIVVFADGSGMMEVAEQGTGREGYLNRPYWRYEDFFFEEFIPFIDSHYSTVATKRGRAVTGVSMGGGGALIYGFHHPGVLGSVTGMSSCIMPYPGKYDPRTRDAWRAYYSDPVWWYYVGENNPFDYLDNASQAQLNQIADVRWFFRCGTDDSNVSASQDLSWLFSSLGIDHDFKNNEAGDHSWKYWSTVMPDLLKFVSDGFSQ